jgi:flagellar basal-body rod protein FlgC
MLNCLNGITSTAAALNAERIRMDVIAENIANAHTTRSADGKPYQRQQVVFETVLQNQPGNITGTPVSSVQVARIEADKHPPILVHNPGHPDADAHGMVAMPNVNVHQEMADMLVASRAFEANLAVVRNARSMALQSLSIGKRS